MTRIKHCVECGAQVYVYAKSTAMCEDCVERIWTKLKEFGPLVPECGDKEEEEEIYIPPNRNISTNILEKPPKVDRVCLKCSENFKALGKFNRICDACKERGKFKENLLTIYE